MNALVTGFGPFLDVQLNPSWLTARRLAHHGTGPATIIAHELPVTWGAARGLPRLVAQLRPPPTIVICLGVGRGDAIRIERQARNLVRSESPDSDGLCLAGQLLFPDAPATLRCDEVTLALVEGLALASRSRGGPTVVLSEDAGGYLCNATLFAARYRLAVPALFVHLPPATDAEAIDANVRVVGDLLAALTLERQ